MCGLWTSIGFDPPAGAIESVAHRGPDGAGAARFDSPQGPVTLLHRRLAIYDLDLRSAQPFALPDGRTIVFNGAIYNFRQLRAELTRAGHDFRTDGDTEVLAVALAHWGEAALHRLNGMFAFVVYDPRQRTLFAARDRFGVKPLYVWAGRTGDNRPGLAFASEIKQLLTLRGMSSLTPRGNRDALADFLAFGLTDHGRATCFAGIQPLPAGHWTQINLDAPLPVSAEAVPIRQWYALPEAEPAGIAAADAAAALGAAFMDSVSLRLSADVPVGSCLSGGLDSSSVVGAIARLRGDAPQHTVSAIFPGVDRIDESRFIAAVQRRHPHVVGHAVTPDAGQLTADLDRILWHQDEPFASTSIFAQWCVFQQARASGLTVMLDGQGADELLGGYHPMLGAHLAQMLRAGRPIDAWRSAHDLRRLHGHGLLRQARWLAADIMPGWMTQGARRLAGSDAMSNWLREPAASLRVSPHGGVSKAPGMDRLSRRMIRATSLPMLLRFEDRNSMAHGIEARVPFLDYRLVETVLRFGGRFNVRDGETKWLLRRAAADLLPREVLERRDKIGFTTPESAWMRGRLGPAAEAGIASALDRLGPLIHADRVRRDCADMLAGRRPYDGALWRLWCASAWLQRFDVAL